MFLCLLHARRPTGKKPVINDSFMMCLLTPFDSRVEVQTFGINANFFIRFPVFAIYDGLE